MGLIPINSQLKLTITFGQEKDICQHDQLLNVMDQFDHRILFVTTYAAFNARAIDEVLANMHPDVDWPNGWEGGRVTGHDAVRAYWTRQWNELNPRVEPLRCDTDETGQIVVEVHQVIKDLSGSILADGIVQHVYELEDGLIRRMEIREV